MSRSDSLAQAPGSAGGRLALVARTAALATGAFVLLAYVLRASALVAYPWDWSPDEGLHLEYARRALEAPQTLYTPQAVPFPAAYGPLLPLVTAPLVRLEAPLAGARLLALAWTLLGAAAVGWLLRRRAGWTWAAAGVALYLCAFDISFWSMLLRVDGPMLTLWLCSAAVLLPAWLERDADHLTPGRLAAGTVLLLASVLVKPTAALHGAPLVLGWLLVHRRGAAWLAAGLVVSGLGTLALLQAATDGAFLWVNGLWLNHPRLPGHAVGLIRVFVLRTWPFLVLGGAAAWLAAFAGARPWREPANLLLLGGLAAVPLLGKHGASSNYLIPLQAALVLCTVLWLAEAGRTWHHPRVPGGLVRSGLPLLVATVALALAATRVFPLPTPEDAATAEAFYGYTRRVVERAGGPILVGRPELVYFLTGQPVEVEGTSFALLEAADVPGVQGVRERLRDRRYSLVVETWPISRSPEFRADLEAGYRYVGACRLAWYFGVRLPTEVFLRRDLSIDFIVPAPGVRCAAADPSASR